MAWHRTDSVDEFLTTAGEFLRSRPVENTLLITVADAVRRGGSQVYGMDPPMFGWWTGADGRVDGAFVQTPPYPVLISAAPRVPELLDVLGDRRLPGVNARTEVAETFARAWRQRTGGTTRAGLRTRLFRLAELTPPPPPPGEARLGADRDLLLTWFAAFHAEIGEGHTRDLPALVDRMLADERLMVWQVDGVPVAMAVRTLLESGMVRVMCVYTPRQNRGKGYAGAVTAALTRAALDAGADDVVLFTDLSNPTSNALYQRLGYRPVDDRVYLEFSA